MSAARPHRASPAARRRKSCHRARRGDGTAGGYAYGLARKAQLLEREGWKEAEQLPLIGD